MSTDRELLELAAKAAGLKRNRARQAERDAMGNADVGLWIEGNTCWHPLSDDGEEARLESALQMHVEWRPALQTVSVGTAAVTCTEPYGSDRQAARRRAGVRAAAAIGKEMP